MNDYGSSTWETLEEIEIMTTNEKIQRYLNAWSNGKEEKKRNIDPVIIKVFKKGTICHNLILNSGNFPRLF